MTAHDNGSESEDSGTENELTTASDKADRGDATSATEPATSQDVSASDEASPPTSEAEQRWGSARLQVVAVGALVALVLVVAAVSMSASGFRLDVERWVLIGAFLVVIAMAAAAMVSALNALKDAREQSTGLDAGRGSGDDGSGNRP